jgi:hypothetical protein
VMEEMGADGQAKPAIAAGDEDGSHAARMFPRWGRVKAAASGRLRRRPDDDSLRRIGHIDET